MLARGRRLSKAAHTVGLTETLRKRPGQAFDASELKRHYNGDSGQVVGKNAIHSLLEDVSGITITKGPTGPIFCWTGNQGGALPPNN